MSLRRYYRVLGLNEGASKDEVKRAYRQMVMKYHPDRNPSPSAAKMFAKVHEAYEILFHDKPAPDAYRFDYPETETEKRRQKRQSPEQAKEAQRRQQEHVKQEFLKNEAYFKKLTTGLRWSLFRFGSILAAVIALLIVVEKALPTHFSEDKAQAYSFENYRGFRGGKIHLVELEEHGKLWIEGGTFFHLQKHPKCFVEKTWIFHTPLSLTHPLRQGIFRYPIEFGARAYFPLTVIFLLLPIVVMRYKRKNTTFSILYHFSFYLIIPLSVLFLLSGHKWAHMMTLGFF